MPYRVLARSEIGYSVARQRAGAHVHFRNDCSWLAFLCCGDARTVPRPLDAASLGSVAPRLRRSGLEKAAALRPLSCEARFARIVANRCSHFLMNICVTSSRRPLTTAVSEAAAKLSSCLPSKKRPAARRQPVSRAPAALRRRRERPDVPQPRKPTRSCSRASAAVARLRRQLKHCRRLTLAQERQQHGPPIWKFERIVMCGRLVLVDLSKNCRPVADVLRLPSQQASRQARNFPGEGQFRSRHHTNRHAGIFRGGEAARPGAEISRHQLIADFRRPRAHALEAKVTHWQSFLPGRSSRVFP